MARIHLVCNAHIDPVWLWEWEEGAAEAVSTFRTAADFCERYDGFVFNHNEAILYQWVEEYEPALFERIRRLVAQGRWHVCGGWYLQPDCNMPSGESLVRQILLGRVYFRNRFGVEPTTAINFDPFGHSRGLVQVLVKSGYDSYVYCKPNEKECPVPAQDFRWVGIDGSSVKCHCGFNNYLTLRGEACAKVEAWQEANPDRSEGMILWGIGNHGGGPSRVDLEGLAELGRRAAGPELIHSTPEGYFQGLALDSLPTFAKDIRPYAVGCYTSQVRIKQRHRLLENELYMTEKMLSSAALQGLLPYPSADLAAAVRDLCFSEFHDILPGSSIQPVEEAALRLLDHGLETVSRLRARAFFALSAGQEKVEEGTIPVLVYNPHPYPVRGIFECEFQLADQNWKDSYSLPEVYHDGRRIPSQNEKEYSNLNLDWRKHVVFEAELEPSRMNRFDCRIRVLESKPTPALRPENGKILFHTDELEVEIDCRTGLVDRYRANGMDCLQAGAFRPLVMMDDQDPWGLEVTAFRTVAGAFALMDPADGTAFSGLRGEPVESVRVIEDGEVRTVIEAVMRYGGSTLCQTYRLPKRGTEIEVEVRVFWNEKDRMLKLSVPTVFHGGIYRGQTAFGATDLPDDGSETVAHQWTGVFSSEAGQALTCVNEGSYGSDCLDGEIRLSLLRSPGYSALRINDRPVMAVGRFSPRIDQGERVFRFWFNAGESAERAASVDSEAALHNQKPFALSFCPSGEGRTPEPLVLLEGGTVQLSAFKKAEDPADEEGYVVRLYEVSGQASATNLRIPPLGISEEVRFGAFEAVTFRVDARTRVLTRLDMTERSIEKQQED